MELLSAAALLLAPALALAAAQFHGNVEVSFSQGDYDGDGTITYRDPVQWSVGDHARTLYPADVNNDGTLDLLVAYETVVVSPTGTPGAGEVYQSHVIPLLGQGGGNLAIDDALDVTTGPPGWLVVKLKVLDFDLDGRADFDVFLSLDPRAPDTSTTRFRYRGSGDGRFVLASTLPCGTSQCPPLPDLPPLPILVDLDAINGADQVFVNRLLDDVTVLPTVATPTPGDVSAPDAFPQPRPGTYSAAVPVLLRPTIDDPCGPTGYCLFIYYTIDGTDPNPGSSSTFALQRPFDAPVYLWKTTTLRWFARRTDTNPARDGPIRSSLYTLTQPAIADSDGDGIPDAYEISVNGAAKPGYDPHRSNLDTDGDGRSDLLELLEGTDPFSKKCWSLVNTGQICASDGDCASGQTCAYSCRGSIQDRCLTDADCPTSEGCGDLIATVSPGEYLLSGSADTWGAQGPSPVAEGSLVRTVDPGGGALSNGTRPVDVSGVWSALVSPSARNTLVSTFDRGDGDYDGTREESDILLARFLGGFELPSVPPPEDFTTGDDWLSRARVNYAQDQTFSGVTLDPASSAMTALAGHEAGERLVELLPQSPLSQDARLLGRPGAGFSGSQLSWLSAATDLATHAFLLNAGAARAELTLLDEYVQFSRDLFGAIGEMGAQEMTPSDRTLQQHLDDGGVCLPFDRDGDGTRDLTCPLSDEMASRDYDSTRLSLIAARAKAESGALSGTVEGAVGLDRLTAPPPQPLRLESVQRRPDIPVSVAEEANGDAAGLQNIESGGAAVAEACRQAVIQEGAPPIGPIWGPSSVTCGSRVLYSALQAADGDSTSIEVLVGRMDDLVFDILGANCDPGALAALSDSVDYYIQTDATAPTTTASPPAGLFGPPGLQVILRSDEPATVYVRTDGRNPVKGEAGTSAYSSGTAVLLLDTDTEIRFFAADRDGNTEAVRSALYRLDRDGDGVADTSDNCLYVANGNQSDADADGTGDACDGAVCGNGVVERGERCDDGNTANGDGCSSGCQPQKRVNLSSQSGDLTIVGEGANQSLGRALAVGELTGDGTNDIVVAATSPGPMPGVRIVSSRGLQGPATRDLLADPAEVVLQDTSGAECGADLAVEDLNNDGRSDLVMGCPAWTNPYVGEGLASAGAVFVYLGPIPLGTIQVGESTAALAILGDAASLRMGVAVAAGDWDGDGDRDILAGAPEADPGGRTDAGRAILVTVDPVTFPETVNLYVTPAALDLRGLSGDRMGAAVALGDADGDGKAEVAVGAPSSSPGGKEKAGAAYIYTGHPPTGGGVIDISVDASKVATLVGAAGGDEAGWRVLLSDFDDDGRADLVLSAPGADATSGSGTADRGKLYVETDARDLTAGQTVPLDDGALDFTVVGALADGRFGEGLSGVDLDGDRRADLIAGAPSSSYGAGRVVVIQHSGRSAVYDLAVSEPEALVVIAGGIGDDNLGMKVASGDLDGDGVADLVASAPGADRPGRDEAGTVYAFRMPTADSDRDGVLDNADPCPLLALATDPAVTTTPDADGDGRGDPCDNCPFVANADQLDRDDDRGGDACDPDPLAAPSGICDGVFDVLDGHNDSDDDGWGDACDCAPTVVTAHQGASELCDGVDSNCDGAFLISEADADADAYAICEGDCADDNPYRRPGIPEACNGMDDDCNGAVPAVETVDADLDGFVACADCRDTNTLVHPGAPEVCGNTLDDNCNGALDCQEPACGFRYCNALFGIVLNEGGSPAGGVILMTPSYRMTFAAIGEGVVATDLATASYRMEAGVLEGFPPPGEVRNLRFTDATTLVWDAEPSAGTYNVYRGTVSDILPDYGACRHSGVSNATAIDGDSPNAGQSFFYLITVVTPKGEEGTKGFNSAGSERPNPNACP